MHDCVIVPGLGGFIANYAPAKINAKNIFSPPSKHIAFNINLKNNDGLLVSHIATKENISFALATKIVSEQVKNWHTLLNNAKKLNLQNIGCLYLNKDLNIQFDPAVEENLLLDSFGLIEFNSPAIKRDPLHKKIEKQFKDRPAIRQKSGGFKWKKVALTVLAVPLLVAMALLPYQKELFYNISVEYSTLNPFNKYESPQYQPRASDKAVEVFAGTVEDEEIIEIEAESQNLTEYQEYPFEPAFDEGTEAEIKPEVEITATPAEVLKTTAVENHQFFIIGGCFSIEENAENFIQELIAKGHPAKLVDKNKGLYRVSYGSYASKDEAKSALPAIKGESNGAWILKK